MPDVRRTVLALGLLACHDPPSSREVADVAPRLAAAPGDASPHDASPPPRCSFTGVPVDKATSIGDHVELGEATRVGDAFAAGALRLTDGGRVAAVVEEGASSVDLGPSWGDAPPPQPFTVGSDLYAVAYVDPHPHASAPRRSVGRALSVYRVSPLERLVELPSEGDASAEYDVLAGIASPTAPTLVAWDDAVGARGIGVIDVAVLSHDLRKVEKVRTFTSPPSPGPPVAETSASDPRLAARPGGYWLTWVARRPEHPVAPLPLPAGEVETPSEEATYGWLEALSLDAEGAAVGTPTRLTSATGHVGAYTMAERDGALYAVAVDEGGAGRGGSLLDVTFRGGATGPEVSRRVHSGVDEEAAPTLVLGEGGAGWVTFADVHGGVDIQPLGARSGVESTREPLLERGRILGVRAAAIAVAVADGARWTVRSVACGR